MHIRPPQAAKNCAAEVPVRPSIRSRPPREADCLRPGIANPLLSKNSPNAAHKTLQQRRDTARASYYESCCWIQFSRRAARLVWLAPATPCGALNSRFWSWRRDLNPRPSDYKSDALPAELRQHCTALTQLRHAIQDSHLPAGTNTELNTTACRVQPDNRLSFQQLSRRPADLNSPLPRTGWLGILQSAFVRHKRKSAVTRNSSADKTSAANRTKKIFLASLSIANKKPHPSSVRCVEASCSVFNFV